MIERLVKIKILDKMTVSQVKIIFFCGKIYTSEWFKNSNFYQKSIRFFDHYLINIFI